MLSVTRMGVNLTEGKWYYIVLVFLFLLNLTVLAPPFLIFAGYESMGASLYNLHNYDHQWIYRSQCVFKDTSGNMRIEDCIVQGRENESKISTLYTTNGDPRYNGVFNEYKQNQLGWNKAEKVERNGMVGYKFANDTRDYAIYLPMFFVMLIYPYIFGKGNTTMPPAMWYIIALIPIGIDGTTQLLAGIFNDPSYYWLYSFGLKESTNVIRWITGAIAGLATGYFSVPMLNRMSKK